MEAVLEMEAIAAPVQVKETMVEQMAALVTEQERAQVTARETVAMEQAMEAVMALTVV